MLRAALFALPSPRFQCFAVAGDPWNENQQRRRNAELRRLMDGSTMNRERKEGQDFIDVTYYGGWKNKGIFKRGPPPPHGNWPRKLQHRKPNFGIVLRGFTGSPSIPCFGVRSYRLKSSIKVPLKCIHFRPIAGGGIKQGINLIKIFFTVKLAIDATHLLFFYSHFFLLHSNHY